MLAEWKQRASLDTGVHAATYLLQVMLHLWILHLGDPAIVSQLHSDDCNSIQLVDVVKLLVSPPLLRYQSLGTYSKQHHISNRRKADQNTCMAQYHSTASTQGRSTCTWLLLSAPDFLNAEADTSCQLSHSCKALHLAAAAWEGEGCVAGEQG